MRTQSGLTLVELLVTLAVIGVMVGVAFPSFRALVERNSLTTTANAMVLATSYARSEALRGAGTVCVRHRGSWPQGWEVIGNCNVAGSEEQLRIFEPIADSLTLTASGGITELAFNNQGMLDNSTPRIFTLCLPGDSGVRISVAATGRPSTEGVDNVVCPAS